MTTPQQRAARLVRWYPQAWRARYGDEFTELLIADMIDRPRSPSRTFDIVRSALRARLDGGPASAEQRALATRAVCLAVFLTFGVALWSQLTIGWQWSAPAAPATALAMQLMTSALAGLVAIGALAAAPLVLAAIAGLLRREARLRGPVALFVLGTTVLIIGSLHFAHGWPGSGGRPWAQKSLVPAGPASFAWAATLSITSYRAHPGKLGAFPVSEVAWMVVAPLAIACAAAGAARTVARLRISPRLRHFEAALARSSTIAMLGFLAGAAAWALGGDPGPRRLFSSGAIDVLDVAMMALALAAARRVRVSAR